MDVGGYDLLLRRAATTCPALPDAGLPLPTVAIVIEWRRDRADQNIVGDARPGTRG